MSRKYSYSDIYIQIRNAGIGVMQSHEAASNVMALLTLEEQGES